MKDYYMYQHENGNYYGTYKSPLLLALAREAAGSYALRDIIEKFT